MEVYIDLLFAVNFGLNCWTLWLTSLVIGQRLRRRGLWLSAALGAIFGLGLVTPWAAYFTHPVSKLLLAAGMVQIAFRQQRWLRLLQLVGLFLLVSFVTAGCVLGVNSLMRGGGVTGGTLAYGELPLWVLLIAVLALGLSSQRAINLLENRLVHVANRATISFELSGKSVSLSGLVDSGNQLAEPIAGRPVAIIALAAVAAALPEEMVALALADHPFEQALDDLAQHPWAGRVRFIPYHSVGRKSGVLPGWRLDQVTVATAAGIRQTENVVLAFTAQPLSEQNEYQALIPQRLLPAVTKSVEEVRSCKDGCD